MEFRKEKLNAWELTLEISEAVKKRGTKDFIDNLETVSQVHRKDRHSAHYRLATKKKKESLRYHFMIDHCNTKHFDNWSRNLERQLNIKLIQIKKVPELP